MGASIQVEHEHLIAGGRTLVDVARVRARRQPDRLAYAFIEGEVDVVDRMTYAEVDRKARAIAAALMNSELLGVDCAPGDRVILMFAPGLEYVQAFLGCLYAGRVAVPTYPPLGRRMSTM